MMRLGARLPPLAAQARRSFATRLGERLPIRQARQLADGDRAAVGGWIKSVRKHKSVTFVNVNDGSCLAELQLTLPAEDALAAGDGPLRVSLADLTVGASVFAEGVLREVPGKHKRLELHPERLEVLGTCDAQDYPLQKKYHSLEFLREHLHLRARTNTFGAVTRVRNALRCALLAPGSS
jgi:asparaginyl-tRNA synthetase